MKSKLRLKSSTADSLLKAAFVMLWAFTCQADPPVMPPAPIPATSSQPAVAKAENVNYIIRVEWKDAKGSANCLKVVTAEGKFKMDTFQLNPVKINNADIPVILTFDGHLAVINAEKGRLNFTLGKKTPVVTSASGAKGTNAPLQSYQYITVGLESNVVVTFGKPLVIQADENGEVSLLVKREEN